MCLDLFSRQGLKLLILKCKRNGSMKSKIVLDVKLGKEQLVKPVQYDMFYGALSDMLLVSSCMMKKMKVRQTIIDNG
jgi:hypothetical protein